MENNMREGKIHPYEMVGSWILGFQNPLKERHDAKAQLINAADDMTTEEKLSAHKKNDYQYYKELIEMYGIAGLVLVALPKLIPICSSAFRQIERRITR